MSKILLVEGVNDEHVLKHICGNRRLPHLDEVRPHGNVERLLDAILVQLKASDEEGDAVGVVVDADADLHNRWRSIRTKFQDAGFHDMPETPAPDGTILDPPDGTLLPRAGVWIMPNNRIPGILEDFLKLLIPQPNSLLDHVETSVAAIPPAHRRFRSVAEPKAIIYTWLAWQKEPGMPPGSAITAGSFDATVTEVDRLVGWLERLFFRGRPPSATVAA